MTKTFFTLFYLIKRSTLMSCLDSGLSKLWNSLPRVWNGGFHFQLFLAEYKALYIFNNEIPTV